MSRKLLPIIESDGVAYVGPLRPMLLPRHVYYGYVPQAHSVTFSLLTSPIHLYDSSQSPIRNFWVTISGSCDIAPKNRIVLNVRILINFSVV